MKKLLLLLCILLSLSSFANKILIPMDESQANHLKSYGIAFWTLQKGVEVEWLLNYRGGSFMISAIKEIENECLIRGVSYEVIADVQAASILNEINQPEVNMEVIKLEKVPKIAVYSPKTKQPWDDAVTLVLSYAEIPYEVIYDAEIMDGLLPTYDWLHLHHEDFTGQFGRFYNAYKNAAWYQEEVRSNTATANQYGFNKVSELKRAVAIRIKEYTAGGGFLFTMCSGTDSYDIALAAENVDICESMYDGDPASPNAQQALDFNKTFAFKNFHLEPNPLTYEFSDIDGTEKHGKLTQVNDLFTLFDFSAKYDVVPTMLTQNHTKVVKGFMGQSTSFGKGFIKSEVLILGETKSINVAKYIHGTFGMGQWTFYGGHDPEDYRHMVGDPPTDLNLHPNSPGYRLILNNVLFPAAKKKKQKT